MAVLLLPEGLDPLWRKKGIGQHLLFALSKIAADKHVGRINVFCVRDNIEGQQFYQKIGAEKRNFVDLYSIQIKTLLELGI